MSKYITRRKAIMAGTASAGMLIRNANGASVRESPALESHPPFLTPWSPPSNLKRDLTPGKTTIRLGGHLNPGKDPNPDDIAKEIKKIKDEGNTGLVTGPEPWNSMKESELSEVRAALKEHDVVFFEVGGYTNMIHPDESKRQENLKKLCTCIEAADKIDCPMVGTISGSLDPVNFFNVHPDNWTQKTWDLLVKSVKQVLRDTSGMKAAIGMEAQVTTNQDNPLSHKRLIEDVGDPRCAVNLDPVNMMSLAVYYHTTELINECFDLLGESILGSHAKDTYIWPDQQTVHVQEVCAGRGVLDYETYLVRLSRLKWSRTLLPEHVPADQLTEAAEYIRKVAVKVGVKIHGD